ncbi:MAG: peptide MFS transporter [Janthinobacterium lividum]
MPIPTHAQRFSVVLLIELWERFGFYGMQALLLLFMVERLGLGDAQANLLWGAFTALLYCAPVIGGWLGDNALGSRRCMILGAVVLAIGYLLMSLPSDTTTLLYVAMGAIVIGTGLFKPNAANLVRNIFAGDDSRLDAAFTLYYMSVNIGSTVSILLTPWIKDRFGWHPAFAVCCAGLVAAIAGYSLLQRRLDGIGSSPDQAPLHPGRELMVLGGVVLASLAMAIVLQHPVVARTCVWLAAAGVVVFAAALFARASRAERPGLAAMYILTLQAMMFFIFYQQQATSLTLFALRNVDTQFRIGGTTLFSLSAGQFQALNPIWIMVLSPVLAFGYSRLGRSGRDLPVAVKFLIGYVAIGAACLIWFMTSGDAAHPIVSPWSMVAGYGLVSLGELLTNGLGFAMVARYVPKRTGALMMGAYLVAAGVALYLGGMIANWAAIPHGLGTLDPAVSLPIYHALFFRLFLLAAAIVVVCAALLPVLRRLDQAHHRLRES